MEKENGFNNKEEISTELSNHLRNILTSSGPREMSKIREVISPIISREENLSLINPPSENKIKKATFQLGFLKSLGPDGLPAKFYQHMWEDVDPDIV